MVLEAKMMRLSEFEFDWDNEWWFAAVPMLPEILVVDGEEYMKDELSLDGYLYRRVGCVDIFNLREVK